MTFIDYTVCVLFGAFLGWMFNVIRSLWTDRKQPVRQDAPTGDKPWLRPQRSFWRDK